MSTAQILFGVGLILVPAVGSQVVASRLRIPALIILLPAGFTVGALTTDVNPDRLLGAAFQPLVSLAGAGGFYDSGRGPGGGEGGGGARRGGPRLGHWGGAVPQALAAGLAAPVAGHVGGGGAHARRDLGGVRADGGGPAAGVRPAL